MNLIQATFLNFLPPKRKQTPSGWISFNAPCCVHNGDRADKRQRGGVKLSGDDGFQFHCFNCGFKAGWMPGKLLSKNTKSLMRWLGMPDDEVSKLSLEALKNKDELDKTPIPLNFALEPKNLPENCLSIETWIDEGCEDPDFLNVIGYILDRGMQLDWYDWMWCPEAGYKDRVIVPFFHENVVVGWTARKIKDGKPKYLTSSQPGYVFNLGAQVHDRKFVIVVEGQFDAIAIDGVAIGHNEPNDAQIMRINSLGREVIVVPDNDKPGAKLIKAAIDNRWSVSLPDWGPDVKDVADAVKKFGRIYTFFTILKYRESGEIKIKLLKKQLENKHDDR
jgi:hypothetical protein